jgi:hypothetical protein
MVCLIFNNVNSLVACSHSTLIMLDWYVEHMGTPSMYSHTTHCHTTRSHIVHSDTIHFQASSTAAHHSLSHYPLAHWHLSLSYHTIHDHTIFAGHTAIHTFTQAHTAPSDLARAQFPHSGLKSDNIIRLLQGQILQRMHLKISEFTF